MKIYFDGCAKTGGFSRTGREDRRYPKLLCEKLNAEEHNLAHRGGNNRRIVRNLLEHDLSQFDLFIIQMTKRSRLEFYDRKAERWVSIGKQCRKLPQKITGLSKTVEEMFITVRNEGDREITLYTMWKDNLISLNDVPSYQRGTHKEVYTVIDNDDIRWMVQHYLHYYRCVYTEQQGKIDEQNCYTTIKSLLKDKKHIIMYMSPDKKIHVPVDLIYQKGKDYVGGFYMGPETHQMILNDIENLL